MEENILSNFLMFWKLFPRKTSSLKNEESDFPNGSRENKFHKWHSTLIVPSPRLYPIQYTSSSPHT